MPVAVDSPPPTPALLTDDSAREQARLEKQLVARHLAEQKAAWEATAKAERERVARERADRLRLQREQAETARQDAIASAAKEKAAREQAEQDRQVKAAQARREARERVAAERTRRLAEHKARAERAKQAHDEAVAQARADREARTARLRADKETKEAAWRASHATRPANLVRLAFHRTETETQLALHLSAPVVYAVRQSQPDKLMLDLEHTQIALPNNRRELDTHFFGTAVTRIIPHEDKAHARVTIEMQLASSVPYEVKTDGSTLTVVFHALPEAGMIAAP
jgi:colicin import membrane protein